MRDAVRFIARDRRLRSVFVTFTVVGTFAFNYSVSLLAISNSRFGERTLFGVLLASTGFGSMVGSLLTAARERVTTRWFLGNGLLLGLAGLGLSWSPTWWTAVVWSVPVGMGGAAFIAGMNAIVQQEAPSDMRSEEHTSELQSH